jgi:hypothetical protein
MTTTTAESRTERIEAQLKRIPAKPGVYLFRGSDDEVLYVGKAKSLRSRVRSYFRGGDPRKALDQLVDRVQRIEVVVTSTEAEAFHLEQNFIKRHRPPFNVRLRDDKSYPYIAVTVEDEYPRVMFTRERHRRGVVYFGPYANAKKVRETLDVLNRVFPYRPCEGPQPGRHSGIPWRRASATSRRRRTARSSKASSGSSPAILSRSCGSSRRGCRQRPSARTSRRRPATGTGFSPCATSPSVRRPTSARSGLST